MTNTDMDFISRNKIVSETGKNFFVEAGAGSGKTTMLVNRMVAMVESGIDISKISAITFTKAAAGEFFERFQKALAERSNPNYVWKDEQRPGQLPAPTDETRARSAAALQNIDLCFMGTIDAFCNMILSEHPTEADVPSDTTIISDDEADEAYKALYIKICDGAFGSELEAYSRSFRSVQYKPKETFVDGMKVLMDHRNAEFRFNACQAIDFDRDLAEKKAQLIQLMQFLLDHQELQYDNNNESRTAWAALSQDIKTVGSNWNTHFSGVNYALNRMRDLRLIAEALDKYPYELSRFFEPHYNGKNLKWNEISPDCLIPSLRSRFKKEKYDVTMTFFTKCVPVVEESMKSRGKLKFFDYLLFLRDTLKKDAENGGTLIRYISERHSFYLIDEFQDTNPLQAEIFFYLTSENPVPKWDENVPKQGSLFIVGDPKQSIYRFRSADVASFLRVKKIFEDRGGEILELSRNFRSTKQLIEYFNKTFTRMLPEETAEQSKFPEIPVPEERPGEFQGIYTYKFYEGKQLNDHPDESDPKQVGKIIERLVGREEYQIYDIDQKALRPLRYSDFMVIPFGKKSLRPIMARLDELGIETRVEGKVPFEKNKALREIVKIYSAAADVNDRIALYSALTGKIIGLSDNVLLQFKSLGGRLSLTGTQPESVAEDETAAKVAAKLSELKSLCDRARQFTPSDLFRTVMDEFRVYERVEAENLEVVYYTLELLRNAEKAGTVVSLKDGTAYLRTVIKGKSGEERCLSLNDAKDTVHMANLHKIKGLEAPVVILTASRNKAISPYIRIDHASEKPEGYLFKLCNGCSTEDFKDKALEETAALQAERVRQVYVAATRARNVLIICKKESGNADTNSWKDLLKDPLPDFFESVPERTSTIERVSDEVDANDLYDAAESDSALKDRSAETGTFRIENPSRHTLVSKMSEETAESNASENEDGTEKKHLFPALLGTMTHKLMEMLVSSRNKLDVPEAVSEIIREFRTRESEPYEGELTKTLITVANTIRNGGYAQENGSAPDILNILLSADEVHCEVPFCLSDSDDEGAVIWNGVIDVLYRTGTAWHIVDYKTNADGNALDEKYEAQLEAYKKAFKAVTGEEADARVYHINI